MEQDRQREWQRRVIAKGINDIFTAQIDIATQRLYRRGSSHREVYGFGKTLSEGSQIVQQLKERRAQVTATLEGTEAVVGIPKAMRFMDMKHIGNWMIYNRQVWGIMYNEVLRTLKTGYDDYVRSTFSKALGDALQAEKMTSYLEQYALK